MPVQLLGSVVTYVVEHTFQVDLYILQLVGVTLWNEEFIECHGVTAITLKILLIIYVTTDFMNT